MSLLPRFTGILSSLLSLLLVSTADAELHARLGGQAAYDDVLDITWLADAGLSGSDSYANQLAWIVSLNTTNYLGYNDWRLASMSVSSGLPVGVAESVYDCGVIWEPLCYDNELGYMFYYNLGGLFGNDLTGNHAIGDVTLTNVQATYLSGTEIGTTNLWMIHFNSGFTVWTNQNANRHAWVVRSGDVLIPDFDSDGVVNSSDNCQLAANPGQLDSDDDGYGNRCDLDLNNDGIVNFLDLGEFTALFGGADGGVADFNGDGQVNFLDFALFPANMFQPPGPSGLAP